MDSYSKFVSDTPSKGKLFIETDDGEYSEDWKLTIDLSKIWKDHTENIKTLLEAKSADRFTGAEGDMIQKQIDKLEDRMSFLMKTKAVEKYKGE